MDEFLRTVKNESITGEEAMDEIVVKLMQKKLKGIGKLDGHLTAYDSETAQKGKLYAGNIYIFRYKAEKPSKYSYKGKDVYYYDDMPVLLLLKHTSDTISGINLNFCNKGLCTLILNLIQNIDPYFYNGGDIDLFDSGKEVVSNNVLTVLNVPDAASQILAWLRKSYGEADYSFIFRTYSKNNISDFRMVEPWQWKYVPSLDYHGTLKKETLEAIQKMAGIGKITVR